MRATYAMEGLDEPQIGHLRHFANLARQLPNQWSLMKGKGYGQEDFGGYRFQLAYMAYALALTHRHRLPAAPGLFKATFERLIEKILLPEVWMYWRDVSRGGSIFNAHLTSKYTEEWNPVVRDNIMYSAYVQSMALLYNYLFRDDRYAEPGALTFRYWSFFWGGPEHRFEYDQKALNEHIYWQLVESGFLGVACEPNCVFQICNQPAILGFRMHDLVYGGSMAEDVTRSYEQAWKEFGRIGENGHYNIMVAQDTRSVRQNVGKAAWVDAWCGALMNMWNREFVHNHYPRQIKDLLKPGTDGAISINVSPRPDVMGQRVITDDCDFGWVAAWTSEMGDKESLNGLLTHADRHMVPSWTNGGLHYPRNDKHEDGNGNRVLVEPMTGNVLLGYARLNVPDGLWGLYNEPWDAAHFSEPALVSVESNVDLARAVFDRRTKTLKFSMRCREGDASSRTVVIGNLPRDGLQHLRCDCVDLPIPAGHDFETFGTMDIQRQGEHIRLRCPIGRLHDFELTL